MGSSFSMAGISGYDFSGIVNALVQQKRAPQQAMLEKQTLYNAQKSEWNKINNLLNALDDAAQVLKRSSLWTSKQTSGFDTSILSATVAGSPVGGTYNVTVDALAKPHTVISKELSDATLAASMPGYVYDGTAKTSNWDFSFTINGKTTAVTVQKASATGTAPTLSDVVNSINNAQTGATAYLSKSASGNYRLNLVSASGATNTITATDSNSLLNKLGMMDGVGSFYNRTGSTLTDPSLGGTIQAAQDATLTVNGVQLTSASNTVADAIQGLTLNLSKVGTTAITVADDFTPAKTAVEDFIKKYNEAQTEIASALKYNADTKKSGALFGNSTLQGIQSRLRRMVTDTVPNPGGGYTTFSSLGIATSKANYGKEGTLVLDATKFNAAVTTNLQSVANFFSAPFNGVNPQYDTTTKTYEGFTNLFHSYLNPLTQAAGMIDSTETSLDNQITQLKKQYDAYDNIVSNYEESMTLKFSRLETLLSQLSAQGTSLTSQIASMQAQTAPSKK